MSFFTKLLRNKAVWPVLLVWALLTIHTLRNPPGFAFGWDTFGYHLYLPATFIHGDPLVKDMAWVEQARSDHNASATLYQISTMPNGARVVRYPIGLAITWTPWFLMGHVAAKITGQPQDGYSRPYQWAVTLGVMVYLLLGLLLLRSVLAKLFNAPVAWITIVLLVLGTNLLDQSLGGQTMPHLTLFSLYAAILYLTLRWRLTGTLKDALILAIPIGLAALIRPTEIVCLVIPLLWPASDALTWRNRFVVQRKQWAAMGMVLFLIGMVQFTYWKLATGSWLIDAYANPGEGLDLLAPHTIPFLFSFRKGWFLYTPLMLLATLAIVLLWRHRHESARPVLVFFLLNLYLVSSWTCWWYADSFSSRAMVGSYAVMAIPLAALLIYSSRWKIWARILLWMAIAACVVLNLFQHRQFRDGLIHSSRMSQQAYIAIWGRTARPEGLEDLLLVERSASGNNAMKPGRYAATKTLGRLDSPFITPEGAGFDTTLVESLPRMLVDQDNVFTPAIHLPYNDLTEHDHAFLELRWFVRPLDDRSGTVVVTTFEHGGSYAYRTVDIHDLNVVRGKWNRITHWYMTPEVRSVRDPFTTYVWSTQGGAVEVVGPVVIVHEPVAR